jgi:predicted RNA-binding protein with PIN domain
MPYIIDGHNLIPHVGLQLDSMDDELELIRLLQEYCRVSRRQVEVYFDNALAGQPATRKFGVVTAHFVRRPQIADDAIRQRIAKLAKTARNWTVVSADRRVQAEARAAKAQIISSEEFARQVRVTLHAKPSSKGKNELGEKELEEWLELFKKQK